MQFKLLVPLCGSVFFSHLINEKRPKLCKQDQKMKFIVAENEYNHMLKHEALEVPYISKSQNMLK